MFRDVCRFWKLHIKCPKLKRSSSDFHSEQILSPDNTRFICTSKQTTLNGSVTPNGSNTVSPVMTLGKHFHRTNLLISNSVKTPHMLFSFFFYVFSTVHHSIELFLLPTLMHNFIYSLTICFLHYYPRHVSSINMPIFRRKNCIHTASGIFALRKRLHSTLVESGLSELPTCTRHSHQHRVTVTRGCIDTICLS